MGSPIQGFARDLFLDLKRRFELSPGCECDICTDSEGDSPSVFKSFMGDRVHAFSITYRRNFRTELSQVILRSCKPILSPEDEALIWTFISCRAKNWIQERKNGILYLLCMISEMYLYRCAILRRHAQCDPCVVYLRSARTCFVVVYYHIMGHLDIGVAVEGIEFDEETNGLFMDVLKKWKRYSTSKDSGKCKTPDPQNEPPGISVLNYDERNKLDFKTISEEELGNRLGMEAYELVDPLGSDEEATLDEDLIQIKERYEIQYSNREYVKSLLTDKSFSVNAEVPSNGNEGHAKPNAEVPQDDACPRDINNIRFVNPSPTVSCTQSVSSGENIVERMSATKSHSSCTIETDNLVKNANESLFEMKNCNHFTTNPESPVKIAYKMILRKNDSQKTTNNKCPVPRIRIPKLISNQQETAALRRKRNKFIRKAKGSVSMRLESPITMKITIKHLHGDQFTIKNDHPVIPEEGNQDSMKHDHPVPTKDPVTMEDYVHFFMKEDCKFSMEEYPFYLEGDDPVTKKYGDRVTERCGDPVTMKCGDPITMKCGDPVNKKYGNPVNKKYSNPVNKKYSNPVNKKYGNPVNKKDKDPVTTKNYDPVTTKDYDPVTTKDDDPVTMKDDDPIVIKVEDPVIMKEVNIVSMENKNPVTMKNNCFGASNGDPVAVKEDENPVTTTDEGTVAKDRFPFPIKVESPVTLQESKNITIADDSPIKLMIGSPVAIKIRSPISKDNYNSIGTKTGSPLSVTNNNPSIATTESPAEKTVGSPTKIYPECPYAIKIRKLFTTQKDNTIDMKNSSEDSVNDSSIEVEGNFVAIKDQGTVATNGAGQADIEGDGQAAVGEEEKIEEHKEKIPLFLRRNLTQCKKSAVILQTPTQEDVSPRVQNNSKEKEWPSSCESIPSNKSLDSNKNVKMVEILFSSSSENLEKSLSEMEEWTETLVVTKRTGRPITFGENNITDETTNSEPISVISSPDVTPVSSKAENPALSSKINPSVLPESSTPCKSSLVDYNFPIVTPDKLLQVTPEKSPLAIPNRCSLATPKKSPLERTHNSFPTNSDKFPSTNQRKSPLANHCFSLYKPNQSPIATPPMSPVRTLNRSKLENAQKSSLLTRNLSPLAAQRADPPANLQTSPTADENRSAQAIRNETSLETIISNEAPTKFPICSPVAHPPTSTDTFSPTKNSLLTAPSESPKLASKTYSGPLPGSKYHNGEVPTPSKSSIPVKSSLIPKEAFLPNKQILSISSESEITVFKKPEETPVLNFCYDFPLLNESKDQNSSAEKLARDKQQKEENFMENNARDDRANINVKIQNGENKSESSNEQAPQETLYPQEITWYLPHEILSQHDFRCSKSCSLEYETVFEPMFLNLDNSTRIKAPKVFEVVTYESFSILPLKEYQEADAKGDTQKQDRARKTLVNETTKEIHEVVCMNQILNNKLRLIVEPLDPENSSAEGTIHYPNINVKMGDLDFKLSTQNLNSESNYFIRFRFERLDPESTLPLYVPELFRLRVTESCLFTRVT